MYLPPRAPPPTGWASCPPQQQWIPAQQPYSYERRRPTEPVITPLGSYQYQHPQPQPYQRPAESHHRRRRRPSKGHSAGGLYINTPPDLPPRPVRPPEGGQSFGHGAPSSYKFQYSNCTGRRKALLIGINYLGQPNQLRGCINDVTQMSIFLHDVHGYRREDMVILTDDQRNPMSQPTKANILRAMRWLVQNAKPHDSLFFHFSGHGGRTPDLDGDEDDGFDDVIYPVDFRVAGHIVDDDMHDIMVRPLLPGVRLTALFDACHSGTALDLPFIYSTQGVLKEPNLAKEAAQDLISALASYEKGDIGGMATTAIGFFKKAAIGTSARERCMITKTSPADVVMFSGSKDTQTSADTFQAGEARGALTWAFINALKKYPQQSYLQLLNSLRGELHGRYTQKPQLSCSHPLDVNLLFVM
ncbi:hypothetical protein DTO027B5_1954 [Paecilomyces variotii]|nr:hypothetical protein DTO169C6_950 [Paecilomyces variotii]KAJ9267739.1 hypothetical protein DTO195F2_73 [Paecilomyces variotii]KAJ9287554.1 hypothetical protein DTO021C3_4847 [Paecilomyces variotii]KAJ9327566.1 hypothetical protein DTO027B3_1788 [Paecilomyces variotii]KAJ9336273.1 hypothetical protein DTO027B5_1954 [Paecilomyces variotii]